MKNIGLISDLHLDFSNLELDFTNTDILVIAGDVAESHDMVDIFLKTYS